jgi:hypothetical protein
MLAASVRENGRVVPAAEEAPHRDRLMLSPRAGDQLVRVLTLDPTDGDYLEAHGRLPLLARRGALGRIACSATRCASGGGTALPT